MWGTSQCDAVYEAKTLLLVEREVHDSGAPRYALYES